ncbi:class I adenylate cyclase [Teredinibacter franksiae]|uniref:class I adenylate cyclase n=1 Tax=Teredinibacter franksiae TaxID=2761453 RepID=UPI00162A1605|nr:class I adenylate cyclase [Teredinibacter franksiae]
MKSLAIDHGSIEQGLDRQVLLQAGKRFVAINSDRLQRLRNALSERQQRVLDAFPLLFHTNHPMMPGYVSRDTPSRLCSYKLVKTDITLGRSIARSFTANIDVSAPENIYSLFVMGSVGTIAQSEKSDLDIWLCVKPGLSTRAVEQLNRKCLLISDWAMKVRLEVHFFIMDHEAFKRGQQSSLNAESSGSAQRLLLLDEFYRSAIHLAGRKPVWWFVPPQQENNYPEFTSTLLEKRYLRSEAQLDFGGISTIPAGEFVGAGIWQLYKAIESPYKSVLKLLLLETYVNQHPNIQPLSLAFKSRVYEGDIDIDELDSYVMIYRQIEQYLQQQKDATRLELARRCFYFKVNKPLSKPPHGRAKSWQRCLMEKMVRQWGWSNRQIETLDQRAKWKAPQVAEERALLVNELNHSYRFIQEFAADTGAERSISTEELTVLGRKLQAAFERKPGKIEWINPGISEDLSEPVISLTATEDSENAVEVWTAYAREAGGALTGEGEAVKSSLSLVELVLWCYFNGIIDTSTYFDLQAAASLTDFNLRKLLTQFEQWLPLPLPHLNHKSFNQTSEPQSVLLLLNVGKSPTPHLDGLGIQRLSNQADALRYSGFEENLVVSVDIITRNSWNEISSRRYDGEHALLDALRDFLQHSQPDSHRTPPELTVSCIGRNHAATISQRVERWFKEIIHCYYGGRFPATTRYLFEMAGDYYSLQFRGPRLLTRQHSSTKVLEHYLAEEQVSISPVMLDSRALLHHPLRTLTSAISGDSGGRGWSGAIHIFYQRFDIGMEVYIIDEMGVILHQLYRGSGQHSPLKPLHRFLRAVADRQTRMNQELMYDFGIFPIHFHELSKIGNRYQALHKSVSRELPAIAKFDVNAVAHPGKAEGELVYDFYCDDQEFLGITFSDQLYTVVAQYILKLRASREHYPVYLTDLDLSLSKQQLSESGKLSSAHYLKIKDRLEFRLNQAIGILLKN